MASICPALPRSSARRIVWESEAGHAKQKEKGYFYTFNPRVFKVMDDLLLLSPQIFFLNIGSPIRVCLKYWDGK